MILYNENDQNKKPVENKVLTDDDFFEKYSAIDNPFTEDGPYDNRMFETYGEEYEAVKVAFEKDPRTIWTIITQGEWEGICAGWHFVNRTGYIITNEQWEKEDETYVSWDNTELHEQWESLPVEALVKEFEITPDSYDDEEDMRIENFYKWEEVGEQERDRIIEQYKNIK